MSHAALTDDESPAQMPLFISAKEAARLLALSRSRVYELMDEGVIDSFRLGRRRVIPVNAVHEFADRLRER